MPQLTLHLLPMKTSCQQRRVCLHQWTGVVFAFVLMTAACGCHSFKSVSIENPVVGPAPPRVSAADLAADRRNYAQINPEVDTDNSIKLVKFEESDSSTSAAAVFEDTEVVATVNGKPILASDILEKYGAQLAVAKQRATPDQFAQLRKGLLKKDLPNQIERNLLAQTIKQDLKKEQLEGINEQLDKAFQEQMEDMVKKNGLAGPEELEQQLKKQGTSLASLRNAFGSQQLAFQYLAMHAKEPKVYSRSELLEYYNNHISDYEYPAQATWRELTVYHAAHGGKTGSSEVIKTIISELQSGKSFTDVAKAHSEGSTAMDGGLWDWTRLESLADENLKGALVNTPIGEISEVLVNETSFQIVQVIDRKEAGIKKFEDIQHEIEEKLTTDARIELTKKVLADLKSSAIIETIFDDELPPENSPPI